MLNDEKTFSLGTMMAGGNPQEERDEDDFYETPEGATTSLIEILNEIYFLSNTIIIEPCCGKGAISKLVQKHSSIVISSDLIDRGFGVQRDIFTDMSLKGLEYGVITNPPFKLAHEIIEHVLSNWKPKFLALLLKSTFYSAGERTELFEKYKPRSIWQLPWRLDFKNLGRPTMECSWFIWGNTFDTYPIYRIAPNHNPKQRKKK